MAALKVPVTVTAVTRRQGQTWAVTVSFADGTTANYLIPETMATVDGVRISALAMATLASMPAAQVTRPHRVHTRYWPRP
jgi:hypothetical protein